MDPKPTQPPKPPPQKQVKTFGDLLAAVEALKATVAPTAEVYATAKAPYAVHIAAAVKLSGGPPHEPVIIIVD